MIDTYRAELERACRGERDALWCDLQEAIDRAIRCTWSIGALGLKDRIQRLTRLVGPTSWENVSITLLESGVYQQVHDEIGVEYEPPDMARVAEVRRRRDERVSLTLAEAEPS